MLKAILTVALLSAAFAACAAGQVPPGYEIIPITENPYYDSRPSINNHSQVVFATRFGDGSTQEIFLYQRGELTQLTDDDVFDGWPDINDDGTIVWSRKVGQNDTYEIVLYRDGDMTLLTDDAFSDYTPKINNLGHVVWSNHTTGGACTTSEVFFYDGETTEQITNDTPLNLASQSPQINDHDWIVWTRYNYCEDPYESEIRLYRDGVITTLTDGQAAPRGPSINNRGRVAWLFQIGPGEHAIEVWEDGVTWLLTDWGGGPRLNDRGDIAFQRWYESNSTYQLWLYRAGQFLQITDNSVWNYLGDMNQAGEVVFHRENYPTTDIGYMRLVPPGASNSSAEIEAVNVRGLNP